MDIAEQFLAIVVAVTAVVMTAAVWRVLTSDSAEARRRSARRKRPF